MKEKSRKEREARGRRINLSLCMPPVIKKQGPFEDWERIRCKLIFFVQTMKISIWIIGSIFKGHERLSNFTIWTRSWIG